MRRQKGEDEYKQSCEGFKKRSQEKRKRFQEVGVKMRHEEREA